MGNATSSPNTPERRAPKNRRAASVERVGSNVGSPSTKIRPRRTTPRRHKSLDDTKSGQACPSQQPRKTNKKKSMQRTASSSKLDFLEDQDLDDIYDFVKQMTQTNFGGNMLGEFVVRRAEDSDNVLSGGRKSSPVPMQIFVQ